MKILLLLISCISLFCSTYTVDYNFYSSTAYNCSQDTVDISLYNDKITDTYIICKIDKRPFVWSKELIDRIGFLNYQKIKSYFPHVWKGFKIKKIPVNRDNYQIVTATPDVIRIDSTREKRHGWTIYYSILGEGIASVNILDSTGIVICSKEIRGCK